MRPKAYNLTPKERDALSPLLDLTTPHLAEMVEVLVTLARTARQPHLREKAASRVIELHLLANSQANAGGKDQGRMVVIHASQLDAIEAAHRKAIPAEASDG